MSSTASFAIQGQRPYIDVDLAGRSTRFLYDLGNDVTLINPETADRLGLDWRNAKGGFKVKGVAPEPIDAKLMRVPLQIGQTQPINIPVGIAPVRDNLLGREGIWTRFQTIVDNNKIIFNQKGGDSNGLGINIPVQSNYVHKTDHVCCDTRCSNIC